MEKTGGKGKVSRGYEKLLKFQRCTAYMGNKPAYTIEDQLDLLKKSGE
jgi:hypothetical protein